MWSTAPDLARFAIELQRSFDGRSNKVLSREMTRQMVMKHLGDYGLGVALGGTEKVTSFSHAGANEGFTCISFAYLGTGQGAVVMTSGDRGDGLFNEVLRAIAHEYGWADYRPIEKAAIEIDPAVYESYVGEYDSAGARSTIRTEKEQRYLVAPPFFPHPVSLFPIGPDRFFMLERDVELVFVRDAQAKVTGVEAPAGSQTSTAQKVK